VRLKVLRWYAAERWKLIVADKTCNTMIIDHHLLVIQTYARLACSDITFCSETIIPCTLIPETGMGRASDWQKLYAWMERTGEPMLGKYCKYTPATDATSS